MATSPRFKSVHNTRYVYNSKFVNSELFDNHYVSRMFAMCKYTRPNTLFSDVVKKKPVNKSVRNFASTTVKAKINQSKSTGQLSHNSIARPRVNAHKETVSEQQNVGCSKGIVKVLKT